MGAGGAGAGGPALASDPSEMADSSGSGPPGPPCRWKRRLMICWYCFLWVGGRATAGLCSMEPLRLRGRGISASTRATSSSSGTDCASGGSAGCSRVGLRGRVTGPSSASPASSTGASSPSSSGSGSSSAGALGVPRRNRGRSEGFSGDPQDSRPTASKTCRQHPIRCVASGQFSLSGRHCPWAAVPFSSVKHLACGWCCNSHLTILIITSFTERETQPQRQQNSCPVTTSVLTLYSYHRDRLEVVRI